MDVDSSSDTGEIDQSFLLQFSCMNTSDREELINEMQRLLGPNLNNCTASFFLDMSNWNLQVAICYYLDYGGMVSRTNPLNMTIKKGPTETPTVGPCSVFEQSFTMENSGSEQWPGSCKIVQTSGTSLGKLSYNIPPLPPGHTTTVTMILMAPEAPGTHTGSFHLVTDKGLLFTGDPINVSVTVECEMTMALVEQLAALPVPSSRMEDANAQTSQEDKMC